MDYNFNPYGDFIPGEDEYGDEAYWDAMIAGNPQAAQFPWEDLVNLGAQGYDWATSDEGKNLIGAGVTGYLAYQDHQKQQDRLRELQRLGTSGLTDFANAFSQISIAPPQMVPNIINQAISSGLFSPAEAQVAMSVAYGDISPEQAVAHTVGKSAFNDIISDPKLRAQQLDVIDRLDEVSRKGYTDIERAAIQKSLDQVQTRIRGENEGIKQDLRDRGLYNSGRELVMRQMAQQAGTNLASQNALDVQAEGLKRALDALGQSGQLATTTRGQDWSENSAKAQANDQTNQFNANMSTQVALANMNAANQAKLTNASNSLNAQLANMNAANQASQFNAGQKNAFNSQLLGLVGQQNATNAGIQNAYNSQVADLALRQQQAKLAAQQAAASNATSMYGAGLQNERNALQTQNQFLQNLLKTQPGGAAQTAPKAPSNSSDTVSTIGKVVDVGKKVWDWFSDENLKENKKELSDDEVLAVFDKLCPTSYTYKRGVPGPKGTVVGIMAQDIDPKAGMVYNAGPNKAVDSNRALQLALAAISSLSHKVKDLENGK